MSEAEKSDDLVTRIGSRAGQGMVILGLILVYGVGAYWFIVDVIQDPDVPWFIKLGVPAVVIGLTVLFFVVLSQRLKASRTDKYNSVED